MGVEGGAGGGEDVQEGVDGGGGVTQVQNKLSKFLWGETKHTDSFFSDKWIELEDMKGKSSIVAQGGRVSPDLLTHGHGSRLSVSVELHGLHGHGSFTAEGTLVQDGVKHLAGVKHTRFNTKSSQINTMLFPDTLFSGKYEVVTCNTVGTVSSRSL